MQWLAIGLVLSWFKCASAPYGFDLSQQFGVLEGISDASTDEEASPCAMAAGCVAAIAAAGYVATAAATAAFAQRHVSSTCGAGASERAVGRGVAAARSHIDFSSAGCSAASAG